MENLSKHFKLLGVLLFIGIFSSQAQTINGFLKYHDDWGMPNSTVYLLDTLGNIIDSAATNDSGHYVFNQVPAGDYLLTASTTLSAGGVDLGDAFLILLNIFNIYQFNSIQELAADVNGDGSVTWSDYFTIVVGWFTYGYPFPVGDWVFETVPVTVTGAREGGSGGILSSSSTGDVAGSYEPDKNGAVASYNIIPAGEKVVDECISYRISFESESVMRGFHVRLALPDGVSFAGVESDVDVRVGSADQTLRMTWMDESIDQDRRNISFDLRLSIADYSDITGPVVLYPVSGSHFINREGEIAYDVRINLEQVDLMKTVSPDFASLSVGPNPFYESTTLRYSTEMPGTTELRICNASGTLVLADSWEVAPEGRFEKVIDLDGHPAGLYFYTLTFPATGKTHNGSMIKIR